VSVQVPEPNLKEQDYCGCGCGKFGTLKRPWRNGQRCVARTCQCRRCTGGASAKRGAKKQKLATKQLGLSHGQFAGRHEEALQGPIRTECKSTLRHAKPIETAYRLMRAQADAAKSVGDTRPFVASAIPPGSNLVYYVIRSDDLEAVVLALAKVFG